MSIAETNATMADLEDEIRREAARRYAFNRMLAATDRVLWRLEELNSAGVKKLPARLRGRLKGALTDLPAACV